MTWLLVVGEREALRWIVKNNRMAFRKYLDASVQPGDQFAMYVTRGAFHNPSRDEAQIVGIGTFETSIDHRKVTIGDETFPQSLKLKFTSGPAPERGGMPFKPLVPKLSWIRKKSNWAGYVRRSLIRIPAKDYATIEAAFTAWSSRST